MTECRADSLTPTRLDELDEMARAAQERAERATAGERFANLEFRAHAREDVPALAAALQAATAEIRRLRAEAASRTPRSPEDEEAMGIIRRAAEVVKASAAHHRSLVLEAAARLDGEARAAMERAAAMVTTRQESRVALVAAGLSALNIDMATEAPRAEGTQAAEAADDLAAIEAAARGDKAVAERGTPRPWKWWTANSMRELVEENRRLRAGASPFQVMVAEFHRALDFPARDTPTVPPDDEVRLRARLIAEEAFEVLEAMLCNAALRYQREAVMAAIADADVCVEMPALANELADLHYVTSGTAVQLGIDEAPVFAAVHAANMAKAGGGKDERGKARKPAGWRKADIAAVLREQEWTGGEEPR